MHGRITLIHQFEKRGFVIFLAKLLLGVIALVLLIILLAKLYGLATKNNREEQAKITLSQINEAMENAKREGQVRYLILGPRNWFLLSTKNYETLKDFCKDGNCLCMCPIEGNTDADPLICLKEGVCETRNSEIESTQGEQIKFRIQSVPFPLVIKYIINDNSFRMYNFDLFSFDQASFISDEEFVVKEKSSEISPALKIQKSIEANEPSEVANGFLYWKPGAPTNFNQIIVDGSGLSPSAYTPNPLLILAILKEKHFLFEKFSSMEKPMSLKVTASIDLRDEVFEHARALLNINHKEACNKPQIKTPNEISQDSQETRSYIQAQLKAAVECLTNTLALAYTNPETYPISLPQPSLNAQNNPSSVVSWYSGNPETTKKIWETFKLYISE